MRSWIKCALAALLCGGWAPGAGAQGGNKAPAAPPPAVGGVAPSGQTVKVFRVPMRDEQGRTTSQIFGDFARILPGGNIEITELLLEFYKYPDGSTNRVTDMRMTSPVCMYNREKGYAESDQAVRIARDNMVITGTGFMFDNRVQVMQIRKDAKVVLKNAKAGTLQGATP